MSIIRTRKRENPFVQLDKTSLEDTRLSWKAKGLLAYLLSRPDNWQIYVSDLIKRAKDGRDAVSAGIKELEEAGYVTKQQKKAERGRFDGWEYEVYEYPQKESTENGFSENGETTYGKPVTNNNYLNNNNLNTTTDNTGDYVDKIANQFIRLRGKGLILKAQDYQSIGKVLSKVPFAETEILLEDCFSQRQSTTTIHSFTYCENYILERYEALIARQKAVEAKKGSGEHGEHPNGTQRSSEIKSSSGQTNERVGNAQKQRLVGDDGKIPDTECDF